MLAPLIEDSDTIANIAKIEPAIADVPCTNILGLVIYDLPGRDCAAKASNGELKVGDIDKYKTQYIDRKSPSCLVSLFRFRRELRAPTDTPS